MKNVFFLIVLGAFLFLSCRKEPDLFPENWVVVKGQVISQEDQQPVAGVDVIIQRLTLFGEPPVSTGKTNASGRFSFEIKVKEYSNYFVSICNPPETYYQGCGYINSGYTCDLCAGYAISPNGEIHYCMHVPTTGAVNYTIELIKRPW